MNAEVFYLSGTGNSLIAARDIAEKIDGIVSSISSTLSRTCIDTDAETIGIVFPVYHATFGESGIPNPVIQVIKKIQHIEKKYLFALCTHSGAPGFTLENTAKLVADQGGLLSAGFAVKLGVPYPPLQKIGHALINRDLNIDSRIEIRHREEADARWLSRLDDVCTLISARGRTGIEKTGLLPRWVCTPWFSLQKKMAVARYRTLARASEVMSFDELTRQADRSFTINENCNGCGICEKVCPVGNVKLADAGPRWNHRCENCFACYQWCPQGAISGMIVEYEKRFHHPRAELSDFLTGKAK